MAAVGAGLLPAGGQGNTSMDFSLPKPIASVNFSPGEVQYTGVSTDVAIEGSGFFAILLPDGRQGYTRDGQFHVDAQGQLVTKQGYPGLGMNGPVQFDLKLGSASAENISISREKEISQGGEVRGRLRVVEWNNPALLSQAGGGLFLARQAGLQEVANPTERPAIVPAT